ncbi:MAG: YraN family protein [Alphaproteobacteria bacterium]
MAREERRAAYRLGRRAEAFCALLLFLRGYRILARGYRTPFGEIDIVARRGGLVALIEVKARGSVARAAEAVSSGQRARVADAARLFLAKNPALAHLDLRFDAMLVAPWRLPKHVPDAWRPEGPG